MTSTVTKRIIAGKDGSFSCPECGAILSDVRSVPAHRAFFGFIKHVFDNWPETNDEFQPDNPEHLRAYLLVRSGHCMPEHVFRFASKREQRIVEGFVTEEMRVDRARGIYGWLTIKDGGLVVVRPASIAFDKISQKKMNQVCENVFRVIYELTGIDFTKWKEMGPSA